MFEARELYKRIALEGELNLSIHRCSDRRLGYEQLYSWICWWLQYSVHVSWRARKLAGYFHTQKSSAKTAWFEFGEIEAATLSESRARGLKLASNSKAAWLNEVRGLCLWTCFPSAWQTNPISWSNILSYSNNFYNGTPRSTAKFPKYWIKYTYFCLYYQDPHAIWYILSTLGTSAGSNWNRTSFFGEQNSVRVGFDYGEMGCRCLYWFLLALGSSHSKTFLIYSGFCVWRTINKWEITAVS